MKLNLFSSLSPVLLALASAHASEVTYTLQAYGNGSLGSDTFTNQEVTIVATGDSNNVFTLFSGTYLLNLVPGAATVNISGIGSAGLQVSTAYVFANQNDQLAGFGVGNNDVLDIPNAAVANYNLSGPIGPLNGPAFGPVTTVATTLGPLNIQSFASAPYGVFTATAAPEPPASSLAGLSLGALLIAASLRRRRSRGSAAAKRSLGTVTK